MSRTMIHAREYLRVSKKRDDDEPGQERSIDEQHDDNVAAAKREGWRLGKPYRDQGSASRHATNGRNGFDALIGDLIDDRLGADLLVLWESSRGSRQVGEWVELIGLCERRGVRIAVTTHGPRVYDPTNPRDRRMLLEDAVDSEYETAKMSLRLRRAAAASAAAGRPSGSVPFGYRRVYEQKKLVGQEPEPDEAAVVVELFERIDAGHSLRAIERDFADRGVRSRRGNPLSSHVLRAMALNPLYVGQRAHAPGATSKRDRAERATLVDAIWPPLVSRTLFDAVRLRLTDPSRKTTRPGRGVHLLSLIGRCDVCDDPIAASYRRGRREYQCRFTGHVRIRADDLDAYVEGEILDLLSRPDNVERLVREDGDDEALAAARDEVAKVRAELDDLADAVGRGPNRGGLSATVAARAEPAIRARLVEAERWVDELTTPSTLRRLIPPGEDVAERWKVAPMSVRREVARLLLVDEPDRLGELRVKRSSSPGHYVPAADRVRWRRETT